MTSRPTIYDAQDLLATAGRWARGHAPAALADDAAAEFVEAALAAAGAAAGKRLPKAYQYAAGWYAARRLLAAESARRARTHRLDGRDGPAPGGADAAAEALAARTDVAAALAALPPREREILALHWGLAGVGPLTLQEIGRQCGRSYERVRQIERRAFRRLALRLGGRRGGF